MISSMTAFARKQSEHDWGLLIWEIRSVNHRYLEPSFRLPETLRCLEPQLREALRHKLQRGKVEAQLRFLPSETQSGIQLNPEKLGQLQGASLEILSYFSSLSPPSILDLLKWPGVTQEQELEVEPISTAALALFDQSISSLREHRRREGEQLKNVLEQRLVNLGEIVQQIKSAMPEILRKQREKLLSLFEDFKMDLDPGRLEQETVLVAQKADIDEEVDRLETHINEVRRVLEKGGAIGRRLDFLMQELNREANTICSKATVTETTLGAVELKVIIEQMREQIQNIE